MTDDQHLAVRLELDAVADPIRGCITAGDGEAQEFVGWLGLASAIERLLTPADDPSTPTLRVEPSCDARASTTMMGATRAGDGGGAATPHWQG
jgi:hypothetical protein